MIPYLSAPLVKDIRTGEGILEYALSALSFALAFAGDLGFSKAAAVTTIAMVSKAARRGLLKAVAAQKGLGIGAPLQPAVLSKISTGAEAVLDQIAAAEAAASALQAKPGTPADQVITGLAPSPPPAS